MNSQQKNAMVQANLDAMIQAALLDYDVIQADIIGLRNDVTALVRNGDHVSTTGICRINLNGEAVQNLRAPHNSQHHNHKIVRIRIESHPPNPANQWGQYWSIHFRPNQNPSPRNYRLVVIRGNYSLIGTNPDNWHIMKFEGLNMIPALDVNGQPAVIQPDQGMWVSIANERQVAQVAEWFQSINGGAFMNIIFDRLVQINVALEGLLNRVNEIPRQTFHPLLEECEERTIGVLLQFNEIRDEYMEFRETMIQIREQQLTAVDATISPARRLY